MRAGPLLALTHGRSHPTRPTMCPHLQERPSTHPTGREESLESRHRPVTTNGLGTPLPQMWTPETIAHRGRTATQAGRALQRTRARFPPHAGADDPTGKRIDGFSQLAGRWTMRSARRTTAAHLVPNAHRVERPCCQLACHAPCSVQGGVRVGEPPGADGHDQAGPGRRAPHARSWHCRCGRLARAPCDHATGARGRETSPRCRW